VTETSLDTWWQEDEAESAPPIQVLHFVTAVVVSRNGAEWLPTTLRSIREQHRGIDQLIAADVASEDASVTLFENA